jgi:hypothetical protein
MLEVFTPNVLNFLPFSRVKENAFPVVEINWTEIFEQPRAHDGSTTVGYWAKQLGVF